MSKEKRLKQEKTALERVPMRKLISMVKQDIRQTIKASNSAAKPKKK